MIKKIFMELLCLVMLTGCSKKEYIIEADTKKIIDLLEADESFIVYIGTTTCAACVSYKPYIKEFASLYKQEVYEVMLDLDTSEYKDELLKQIVVEYTPTTFVIKDGEVVGSKVGEMDVSDISSFVKEHGIELE